LHAEFRLKSRTNIEEIYEDDANKCANKKSNLELKDNQLREKQSKNIHKSQGNLIRNKENGKEESEKNTNEFDFINEENDINEYLNKVKLQKELEKKARDYKNKIKLTIINQKAKEINYEAKQNMNLEDFHRKTHFKGVSSIANYYREKGSKLIIK